MTTSLVVLAAMLAPGVFYWWSGRHLLRHREDPALPERLLLRQQHAQLVVVLGCVLLAYAARTSYWFAFVGLLIGTWIGDFPSRRVLFDEQWTLPAYALWYARFIAGYLGFWFALLMAPSVIHAAGEWRWPVACVLAVALAWWGMRYAAVFLSLVGAGPLTPPAEWTPILERSHAPRPTLVAMPVPGGRFANAFALPSTGVPSVLFTAPLLQLLTAREQAAILAHEMAHLEHYDPRRCRLAAAAGFTLVVLATLGAALALDWVGAGLLILAWSATFVVAFALRGSRQKAHEAESDLRALALCQDAEALISGLTKLHTAGRVPRRWSSEIERYASHPSLARRVQAIQRAAGMAPASPPVPDALVVSTASADARVILDDRGVSCVSGVASADTSDPGLLRAMATASWAVPYSELVELRVAASWWGGAALRVRDRAGTSRTIRIRPADIQALQHRLDAVDARLPHDIVLAGPFPIAGRLTALALVIASTGSLLPLGLVVGLMALLRPSRPALAAVAGTAGAAVLVFVGNLADGGRHWTYALYATGAVVVAALAAWFTVKARPVDWRRLDYVPVLSAASLVVAITAVWVAVQVLWLRPASSVIDVLADAPTLWAGLVAVGCALVTAPRRAVRGAGIAVVAAAVLVNLGVRLGDLEALSRVVAPSTEESRPLSRVASVPLPAYGGSFRVSPLASRVGVAVRPSPNDRVVRLLVVGPPGARTEIDGHDMYFLDEDNALVVTETIEGSAVQHVRFVDRSEAVRGWRLVVAGVRGLRFSAVRGLGWAGLAYDPIAEDRIGVTGRIGAQEVARQRLHADDNGDIGGGIIALAPDGCALRTAVDASSLTRLAWAHLVYSGHVTRESKVWRTEPGRDPRLIASLPTYARCELAGREPGSVVCVGTDRSRTLIWRFDVGGAPGKPLIIPGRGWRSTVGRDGRLVALWTRDEILTIDLDSARANRWTVSRTPGYPIDVVPAAERLVALTHSRSGASVEIYDTRRTSALLPR